MSLTAVVIVTSSQTANVLFTKRRRVHVLRNIIIPSTLRDDPLPREVADRINSCRARIQAFQDRWERPHIEQFVAADYEHVYQVLRWTLDEQLRIGNRLPKHNKRSTTLMLPWN